MKTKTRTASFSAPAGSRSGTWLTHEDPGTIGTLVFSTGCDPVLIPVLDESISYEEPKKRGNGDCVHTRVHRLLFPSDAVYSYIYYPPYPWNTVKVVETTWFWVAYYQAHSTVTRVPTVRSYSWKTLSSQAMEEMMPTFSEGGESLVNFVLELKQLKGLFSLWNKSRSFLQNIANGHLSYSFGWRPFLSDVSRLWSALDSFRKKLRKLQEGSGKPQKRHFRRFMDSVDLAPNLTNSDGAGGAITKVMRWVDRPRYCATVGFTYVLPDMSVLSNQLKAFGDSLGVQWNPSIIWNAIPYSFVIDWFFGVGDWLDSLRSDNLAIPATVTSFCHSIKYQVQDDIVLTLGFNQAAGYRNQVIPLASVTTLRYERRKDIPSVGLFDTTVKMPNWKQILLGGSLVVQRT